MFSIVKKKAFFKTIEIGSILPKIFLVVDIIHENKVFTFVLNQYKAWHELEVENYLLGRRKVNVTHEGEQTQKNRKSEITYSSIFGFLIHDYRKFKIS